MIIGLTGRNGAGKGTVAQWFMDRGFRYTSLSDAIRADLRERGLEVTRDNLIKGGRRLREEGGPGVLAARVLQTLPQGTDAIVDSVRNPAEVEQLRGRPDFVLLDIAADALVRYQRLSARARSGDSATFAEFERHEAAELHSTDSSAQRLVATAALADLALNNDGAVDALHRQLEAYFPTVSGTAVQLPAVDVVITGGAGFLGAALTRSLVERGKTVRCIDIAGFARLGDARSDGKVQSIVADIRDVPQLVTDAGACIHLAAVVGVDRYIDDPLKVLDVNILGSRAVLLACAEAGVPTVIASTSEVYGDWPLTLTEDIGPRLGNLANSRWSYAVSKSAVEQYAHALRRRGLRFAITRYFNVYGPLLDRPGAGRVLGKFLGCVRDGRPLPLVDGGDAVRSLCHVDDAARATLALLDALQRDAGSDGDMVNGRAFNVGRAEPVTIAELARRVISLSGHTAGTVDITGQDHFGDGFEEIEHRVPDVSALKESTGFVAETSLNDGLRQTLAHWGLLKGEMTPTTAPLPFVRPQVEPTPALLHNIGRKLLTGQLTNRGSELRAFETEMAAYLGAAETMATSSGSGALLMATLAVGASGKAVLPAFTYIATMNAAVWSGLEPLLCDIDPQTWTLCPTALARLFEEHDDIGLVMPVNVYGVPPDMAAISAITSARGAKIVYDNAHGFGTVDQGHRFDPYSDAQVFSLHATKNLPAVEGGAIVTREGGVMNELRRLCNHGLASTLTHSKPGFNFKMSELHAAVGRHSLRQLPQIIERRHTYTQRLRAAAAATGAFTNQGDRRGATSNRQNFVVTINDLAGHTVDDISTKLADHGVGSRRYFWPPLNQLDMYRDRFDLPVTDDICSRLLCLPLWSRMDEEALTGVEAGLAATAKWLKG